jgi:two-component system LytT family response regulator
MLLQPLVENAINYGVGDGFGRVQLHADRAFEFSALDYLLKPVDPERLSQALTKLGTSREQEEKPFSRDEKVLFRDVSKNVLIRIKDIHALEASEAYKRIILGDGTSLTVNGTLKSVLQRLVPDLFFPANRTHAINLDHVAKVDDGAVGLTITMTNNLQLELSRRQSIDFRRLKSI